MSIFLEMSDDPSMYPIRFSRKTFGATILAAVFVFAMRLLEIPCVYLSAFGIPCPGCGMTRATLSVLRLDFQAAFRWNAGVFLLPLFYLYIWQNGKVFRKPWLNRLVLIAAAALFFLRYILLLISGDWQQF